ncbi:hypothetical protein [Novosphingobium panipatense]
MHRDPRTQILQPHFPDMGCEPRAQDIAEIVDGFGGFELPQAEKGSA